VASRRAAMCCVNLSTGTPPNTGKIPEYCARVLCDSMLGCCTWHEMSTTCGATRWPQQGLSIKGTSPTLTTRRAAMLCTAQSSMNPAGTWTLSRLQTLPKYQNDRPRLSNSAAPDVSMCCAWPENFLRWHSKR
jgi:hypothetical protein